MRNWLTLILLGLLIQGCRVDTKDPRTAHKGRATVVQDSSPTPENTKKNFFGLNLQELYSASQKPNVDRVAAIILPLANVLLDSVNLASPDFKGHPQSSWALSFFNSQLVIAIQNQLSPEQLNPIIETYETRALTQCDIATLSGCRSLEFFKRDPQTSTLFKKMALLAKDVRKYYRLVAIALELKGSTSDPELNQLIYARMVEYLKVFIEVQTTSSGTTLKLKAMNERQRSEFAFYRGLFATAARASRETSMPGLDGTELFRWLSSNMLESVVGRDLAEVFTELVATQLKQPKIWKEFTASFKREQGLDSGSYSNSLKRVQAYDRELLSKLGIEPYDLEAAIKNGSAELAGFQFISRIFNLRAPSKERYLWKVARLDDAITIDLINAFVRVTLIDRSLDTHKSMAKFFNDYLRDGKDTDQILFEAIRYSERNLTQKWKDYVTRVQQLEQFFTDEIEKRYLSGEDSETGKKVEDLRNLFNQLNPMIKNFVTYPNMIMLGYYAALTNMRVSVETYFGSTIEVTRNLVLHDLMEGNMQPMFKFTSFREAEVDRDSEKQDSVQMTWSLYFAMITDLPKLYNISATEFMRTFFQTYKTPTDTRMRNHIDLHEKLLAGNSDTTKVLSYCAAVDAGKAQFFTNRIDLGKLDELTFLGELNDFSRPPLLGALAVIDRVNEGMSTALDESLEVLRSEVDPKLRRLYLIKSILESTKIKDREALDEIDRQMAETLSLRERLLQSSRLMISELPDCLLKLRDIERQRRFELTSMERDFGTQIQHALNVMAKAQNPEQGLHTLKSQYPFFAELETGLPSEQALNRLFADKVGLQTAYAAIADYQRAYESVSGFQRDRSGSLFYNYRHDDFMVRMALFLQNGFNGHTISQHVDKIVIPFPSSVREMQKQIKSNGVAILDYNIRNMTGDGVLRSLMGRFRDQVKFYNDHHSAVRVFRGILRQQVALFKYDYLGDLRLDAQIECDRNCQTQKQRKAGKTLKSIFDMSGRLLVQTTLKPFELDVLKLFDLNSFYNYTNSRFTVSNGPTQLFISQNVNMDLAGLTDEVFTYLSSIRLGFDPIFRGLRPHAERTWIKVSTEGERLVSVGAKLGDAQLIKRRDHFYAASEYFKSLRDQESLLLFKIDPAVDAQIKLFHRILIDSDLQMAQLFQIALKEWTATADWVPAAQFERMRPPQLLEPVTPTLLSSYNAVIEKFHRDTGRIFDPAASH